MTINARYLIPKFYTKTRQGIFLFCLSVHLQLVALVQKQNVHHSIVWKYVFLFTYSMKTKILSKQKLIRSKKNHSILIAKISSRKTQKSLIRKNKLDRKNLCHTVSIAYRPHGKSLPNILQSLSIQHADFPSVYPVPGLSDSKPGENKMRVIWVEGAGGRQGRLPLSLALSRVLNQFAPSGTSWNKWPSVLTRSGRASPMHASPFSERFHDGLV